MNIFKEMVLSVYSFKSYKEFLGNKKIKVFGFGLMLMLFYFLIAYAVPFVVSQIGPSNLAKLIEEEVPDFELSDGTLWVDDVIEYEMDDQYVYIDTDPYYVFYGAEEMKQYLVDYRQAFLLDSEKIIAKSNGEVVELYYEDLDWEFSKEKLIGWVPYIYAFMALLYAFVFVWITALFFFGVLFVALFGMIIASCMKVKLTFGQLYLLGIYSRTLPLLIKAILSLLDISVPFTLSLIINLGLSLLYLGLAMQKMKEQPPQQSLQCTSENENNDLTWMQ